MRIVDHFLPHTAKPDPSPRNARGEWQPAHPIKYQPVFTWPPRPLAVAKYIIGWPGFMWPRNLTFLTVATLSWYFTEPALSRCTQFKWDWMLQIWARNLALTWLVYGGYHLYFYIIKGEGTKGKYDARWPDRKSRLFLFGDQVYDNIFWTAGVGVLVWSAYEIIGMWLFATHRIPYVSFHVHPVWFVTLILLVPFWREFHFYWIHRFIHWKPLYKHVHSLHHKNVNPGPWSGMAMHPVEQIIYLSCGCIHWIVPSHPIHFLFNLQNTGLSPACSHHGFEGPILEGKWPTGSRFHYLHHRHFECNYGGVIMPFDKWFGTFRDGLPKGTGSNLPEEQHFDSH